MWRGERTRVTSRAAERATGACVPLKEPIGSIGHGLKAPSTQVECDHHGVVEAIIHLELGLVPSSAPVKVRTFG